MEIRALLEVDKEIARYFKTKKYLPSQSIIEQKDDGSLIVQYKVTNNWEMLELLKKWMPYIVVLEPKGLKKRFEAMVLEYLERIGLKQQNW